MIDVVIGVISLVLIGMGLCYFLATIGFGMFEGPRLRRYEALARGEGSGRVDPSAGARPTAVYFLVPCLNEEAVIATTLQALLVSCPGVGVVVVDDASEDRTAEVVAAVGAGAVTLVSRQLPQARLGKGPALNAGLPAIVSEVESRGLDPARVLVCVMDADGRLSEDAMSHVLPLFDDPAVGGVQLGVRISNREANLLTTIQDFEFWGLAATSQLARVRLGTVSLGGNGQFTRLSALRELGQSPWSAALTEDLDLAIQLLAAGWRLVTTPSACVYQQAIDSLPKLIRQRTRWLQGHMACIRRLRSLWASPTMSNAAVLEVSFYLLIPWMFILPWSVLFHVGLWQMFTKLSRPQTGSEGQVLARVIAVLAWYLIGFAPSIFAGYVYYRQDRSVGRLRAFLLGHTLIPWNYIAFVSCWRATLRSLLGRRGWDKTTRRAQPASDPLAPALLYAPSGLVAPPLVGVGALGLAVSEEPVVPPGPALPPAPVGSSPTLAPEPVLTLTGSVAPRGPGAPPNGSRRLVVTGRFRPSGSPPPTNGREQDRIGPHAA